MRKFAVLALLAAFILGAVGVAGAAEIKAKGTWRVHFDYVKNPTFNDEDKVDSFLAGQRARTIFEFVANENLKGVLQIEIGNVRWGQGGGGQLNTDGVNIKTKHAYVNFKLPNTAVDVRAGLQPVALPSTLGSHILSADVGALVANVPFNDMFGLTLGWARPYDLERRNSDRADKKLDDEVDAFMAVLPINLDGISLKPFGMITRWGKDFQYFDHLDKNATMWHAGLNFAVTMLDPVGILGDFNYGHVKWSDDQKQSGFVGVLAVQYAMDMVTPQLFGVYESGEDSDYARNGDSKRMPVVGTDGGAFGPGIGYGQQTSFWQDSFVRTLLADLDPFMPYQAEQGAVGLWAVGAALRDIKFMDNLSHDLVAYYAKGTNDKANWMLMTDEDSYWEVDFNTTYQMYENLALVLELAYGKVSLDELNMGKARKDLADDALMRGVLGFVYKF